LIKTNSPAGRNLGNLMRYPIAIEIGEDTTAYSVVVPDLPGCLSAGDPLDEAVAGAEEATVAWIDAALDDGRDIPPASSLEEIRANPEYRGWSFGVVAVDPAAWTRNRNCEHHPAAPGVAAP
jgi:predicted RNase H-like HicB family nuclease